MDEPINFTYEDTDSFQNEISELYSYSEESEFFANRNAFEESMEDCGLPLTWKHMVQEQKSRAINYLMTTLEVSCRTTRLKSCRALAYLIQGNFGECLSLEEQSNNSQENVFLLYPQGIFQAFVQQLLIEASLNSNENRQQASISSTQSLTDSTELRLILSVLCTITETMYHAKDSSDLKIDEMRQQFILELQQPFGDELLTVILFQMLNNFCGGLAPHYPVRKITLLLWKVILITLGGMTTLKELKEAGRRMTNLDPLPDDTIEVTKNMRPCSPPMKPDGARARTALLKTLVANQTQKRKVFKQPAFDDALFAFAFSKENLDAALAEINIDQSKMENDSPYGDEDSRIDALIKSFASSGMENSTVAIEQENSNSDYKIKFESSTPNRRMSLREARDCYEGNDGFNIKEMEDIGLLDTPNAEQITDDSSSDSGITDGSKDSPSELSAPELNDSKGEIDHDEEGIRDPVDDLGITSGPKGVEIGTIDTTWESGTNEQLIDGRHSDVTTIYKGLPWAPKVRRADLIQHLSNIRQKFLGYTLPNDLETTFGLPDPIIEGVNVLKKHSYVSLSEVQLDREEAMEKYPLTHNELNSNYREEAAEKLYTALLPRLPQYMIALLKILLAASTSSKNKSERSESINIMSEISSDSGSASIIQTMKINADANRHKEIIIKSVSAILILLLKHFKTNHIYQFEYVSQQLMFANCIPLILKFLSQDIYSYIVSSKSTISAIDFPACVIGEQPELTTEAIELCSFQPYCARNMFSCINLVRILNKLTKWKHSRIMMLVVFKSAATLIKALSVRHSMFQLYILKLLKVQLKFLGRQWKKSNMKLISAIYQKVRHRLTDDWAYSNDNEARPWDFQAEEFNLQANINKFHQRRYSNILALNNKARDSLISNQSDKFGYANSGFNDCADEDYDFGNDIDITQISAHFERNYERWLESEVFQRKIDWDKLLDD